MRPPILRQATDADLGFVIGTMVRAMRRDFGHAFPYEIVMGLLGKPAVRVIVAGYADGPELIQGYSVVELRDGQPVVHFVKVKPAYQRQGIARAMVGDLPSPVVATHRPKDFSLPNGWRYEKW